MEDAVTESVLSFLRWLGVFHPVTVHFPVALLIAAAIAELIGLARRRRWFFDAARFCIWGATIGALIAAPLGWLNAGWDLAHDDQVLAGHRWLGSLLLFWLLALTALTEKVHRGELKHGITIYWLLLFGGALLVGITGHLGGMLVFGADYLAR